MILFATSAWIEHFSSERRNSGTLSYLEAPDLAPYPLSMPCRFTTRLLATVMLCLCALDGHARSLSWQEGNRLQQKIHAIVKNGALSPVPAKRTAVSEAELNSYLNFHLRERIPASLSKPQVNLLGSSRLAGRVYVDIDEFKRQRGTRGLMDPFSYLSGEVPVTARGVLRTREGRGQFYLDSAEIYGVPLPRPVLQELVTFFSRTSERPRGFDLDSPFDLPAKIRELSVTQGEALVVQ
jgi:hypothetical protein